MRVDDVGRDLEEPVEFTDIGLPAKLRFEPSGMPEVAEQDRRVDDIAVPTPDIAAQNPRACPLAQIGFQKGCRVRLSVRIPRKGRLIRAEHSNTSPRFAVVKPARMIRSEGHHIDPPRRKKAEAWRT